jgi:hypothetical protein
MKKSRAAVLENGAENLPNDERAQQTAAQLTDQNVNSIAALEESTKHERLFDQIESAHSKAVKEK